LSCLDGRVSPGLCGLLADPEEAAERVLDAVPDGSIVVGASGFGSVGYPKRVPGALAEALEASGRGLVVLTGASAYGMDEVLASHGVVERRYPYMNSPTLRRLINEGRVAFMDYHLGEWPGLVEAGWLHRWAPRGVDVAIVEAAAVGEEGIVPTGSVGASPAWVEQARWVIVEVNLDVDPGIEGLHDIYRPRPGEPVPIRSVGDRVGAPRIPLDPRKVLAIVESRGIDHGGEPAEPGPVERGIAENLLGFLEGEVEAGRLPRSLYPLESGVGTVNDAVFKAIGEAGFKGLRAWTEVVQDSLLGLYEAGVMEEMSCTSLMLTPGNLERLYSEAGEYRRGIVLRPQDVTNNLEVIRRLRVIAINTAAEIDIYGNVNSTHVLGSRLINGIGGSGDYARAAYLSIFIAPSTRKNGRISTIVPLTPHVDTPDHDVDVIVTEQGVCDLRGLSPREKARLIIEECAHPDYRDALRRYYERALAYGGHSPVALEEALSFHLRLRDTGTMRG